jgi:signal transduction histidine kinase
MSRPQASAPATRPSGTYHPRAPVIAVIGLVLVLTFTILRETIVPDLRLGTEFIESRGARALPFFVRPVVTMSSVITELFVLTWLSRRLERREVGTVVTVLATCATGMLVSTGYAFLTWTIAGRSPLWIGRILLGGPLGGLEIYGLWVLAFRYPQLVDDSRLRALEAQRLRQAAEIAHLREHLQPHFLRNTLNAIAALVTEDPTQARDLLAALGDLLTESIEPRALQKSTLGDEMAWLRRYAEILEARYRGTLRFTWDEGPMTASVPVPRLLLQPLVENAVHHGALARDGGGRVVVRSRLREGGGTLVEVEDNGPGFDPSDIPASGLGLRLVRRRLEIESRGGTLRIEPSPAGTRAVVELP